MHYVAKIHSLNPEVQARASAHHRGQFQLDYVCSVRTMRTSVTISALCRLKNTRFSISAETRATAIRTWARRPKANAAISRSWGSKATKFESVYLSLSMEGDILLACRNPGSLRDAHPARRFLGRPGPPHRVSLSASIMLTPKLLWFSCFLVFSPIQDVDV
jgi:hypothetical protein